MDQNRSKNVPILIFSYQTFSDGNTPVCEDSTSEKWKSKNMEATHGSLCDNYVGPGKHFGCDKTSSWCDGKKCGELCKKTCNKC